MDSEIEIEAEEQNAEQFETEELCCNGCPQGYEIQRKLIEHFKQHYDSMDYENYANSCNCQEGAELQILLINHHLSHAFPKPVDDEVQQDYEDEIDHMEYNVVEEEYIEEEYLEIKDEREDDTDVESIEYEEIEAIIMDSPEKNSKKRCLFCPTEYKTEKALQTHFFNEHHQDNHLHCPECNNRFNCEKKLKTHLNRHEADQSFVNGVYVCRICEKECVNKARLLAHLQIHFADYECDYCGKTFTKYEYMAKHVVQHVYTPERKDKNDPSGKVVCCQCSKLVAKDRMKRHNFIYHSNERPWKCEICNRSFKYAESYREHMDKHAGIARYECEHCGKKFYNSSNLRNHAIRHTNPDKFKCEICDERFGSPNSLKLHKMRKHEDHPNEFECSFEGCAKKFNLASNLNNHIRQVHTADEELRNCPHCSYTCYKSKNLYKHVWKIHKIKQRNHRIFPKQNE